jgi:hypothetical protein
MAKVTPDQVKQWAVVLDQLRTGFAIADTMDKQSPEDETAHHFMMRALEDSGGELVAQLVRAGVIKTPIVRKLVEHHCGKGPHPWQDMSNNEIKGKVHFMRCFTNLWLDFTGNYKCTGIPALAPPHGWPTNERTFEAGHRARMKLERGRLASILAHLGEVIAHIKIAKPTGKTSSPQKIKEYRKIYDEVCNKRGPEKVVNYIAPTALKLCNGDKASALKLTHTAYKDIKRRDRNPTR